MPSLRRPPLARTLGALLAALLVAPFVALAQSTDPSDRFFMRPQIDGDPRNPPRFSRDDLGIGQTAQPQTFTYQPGRGAGTTGFDSSNSCRQKAKKGQKAKATRQGGSPAAGSTAGQASTVPTSTTLTTTTPSTLTSATTPTYVPPATVTLRVGQPVPSATAAHFTQNQNQNQNQAENQNLKQNQIANQTQQPRAAPVTNATYPVGPLVDLPTLPARRRLAPEQDWFAPLGIQVGAFLLRPALGVTGANDTNPARVAHGTPSWYAIVAPELFVNSNWARHELTASLRGSYIAYATAPELDRPSADAKVNGRIDITPWTRADLEGRFLLGTDNPGSPNIQAASSGFRSSPQSAAAPASASGSIVSTSRSKAVSTARCIRSRSSPTVLRKAMLIATTIATSPSSRPATN